MASRTHLKPLSKKELQEKYDKLSRKYDALHAFTYERIRAPGSIIELKEVLWTHTTPSPPFVTWTEKYRVFVMKLHRADGGHVMLKHYNSDGIISDVDAMSGVDFVDWCRTHRDATRWSHNTLAATLAEYETLQARALD